MKDKIICPDELKWLLPYYYDVKGLLPKHTLSKISHAKLSKGKIQRIVAQLWKIKYSYKFELTMYSEFWEYKSLKPLRRKRRRYSKIDMLTSFAHELAHIQHFSPHDCHHKTLEAMFIAIFMKRLDESGYISEESELGIRSL